MKRKVKYVVSIILLLTLIHILLIRLNYPFSVDTEKSIFHMIPIYTWGLLLVIPLLISVTVIISDSKIVCLSLATIYFFVLYSYYLFFLVPPAGMDTVTGGRIFLILQESNILTVHQWNYFQWPIHFLFRAIFARTLGLGINEITFSFFALILLIPLFLSLVIGNKSKNNNKTVFVYPTGYILLSYFFINLQLVPQFTGLVFLILTIGCYGRYKEIGGKKLYGLTILFYAICVLTHPFIFVFFPIAIFLNRYILSRNLFPFKHQRNQEISLSLLLVIYFIGYLYRFATMAKHTRRLILPAEEEMGEAWLVFVNLFGYTRNIMGNVSTYPLYNLVHESTYLVARYISLTILIVLSILLAYALLKFIREVNSFDPSLAISGGGFFLFGLINPAILGQRGFQVIFLNIPRYFYNLFDSNKKFMVLLIVIFTISPLMFNINTSIGHSLSGGRSVQDEETINSGIFIDEYIEGEYNVLVGDLSFYPTGMRNNSSFRTYSPSDLTTRNINQSEIDVVIYTPKLINRMKYYDLELELNYTSTIYDMGDSQVFIIDSNRTVVN